MVLGSLMWWSGAVLEALGFSLYIGLAVSMLSVVVGTCNAFLFERRQFPGKGLLYVLMILPLVIPGVILGISTLVFASAIANGLEDAFDIELDFLRPGVFLIVLGQFSFLVTITSPVIAARLRMFDVAPEEEAALNLGASRVRVLATVTLPHLAPALFSAFVVAFLVSSENFNTPLMLVGSGALLTITMYDRMVKVGSTPVLNAVSVFLMIGSGCWRCSASSRSAATRQKIELPTTRQTPPGKTWRQDLIGGLSVALRLPSLRIFLGNPDCDRLRSTDPTRP